MVEIDTQPIQSSALAQEVRTSTLGAHWANTSSDPLLFKTDTITDA